MFSMPGSTQKISKARPLNYGPILAAMPRPAANRFLNRKGYRVFSPSSATMRTLPPSPPSPPFGPP